MQKWIVWSWDLIATRKDIRIVIVAHRDIANINAAIDGFGHAKIGWTWANALVKNYVTSTKSDLNSN